MGPALQHSDRYWRIGIQNPIRTRGASQMILRVQDKSVVTSGIYERSLTKNGKTFHHILDAHTGYPVKTDRSEEHTSELQSRGHLVCRLLLEKKKKTQTVQS